MAAENTTLKNLKAKCVLATISWVVTLELMSEKSCFSLNQNSTLLIKQKLVYKRIGLALKKCELRLGRNEVSWLHENL